jgi:single-stranded DNA-binding protein
MKSVNTFSLTGRLTADARFFDSKNGKIARFSIAHNFGKGDPALFVDAVIFPRKGLVIPEDLLVKGSPVQITGYLKPSSNVKDGKTYNSIDWVITSISSADEGEDGE